MTQLKKNFMAFSKGNVSSEGEGAKLYVGVGSIFIKAINPTKAQLAAAYNREQENDPVYLGEVDQNGVKVQTVRIEFLGNTDPEKNDGIDKVVRPSITLRNQKRLNADGTKVQVIDEYGRTAWVTLEEAAQHAIPMYKNGPANITANYREAYPGEEQLTNFIKAYLNIPNPMKYVNNEWVMIDHPEDAEARLDHIADYFKGNFKELQDLLSYQPHNKLKILFGVRTTEENKQYQAFYTEMVLKNGVNDYSRLDKDLQERLANAAEGSSLKSTYYEVCSLKEYTPQPTHIEATAAPQAAPTSWLRK